MRPGKGGSWVGVGLKPAGMDARMIRHPLPQFFAKRRRLYVGHGLQAHGHHQRRQQQAKGFAAIPAPTESRFMVHKSKCVSDVHRLVSWSDPFNLDTTAEVAGLDGPWLFVRAPRLG